jgi:exodeoxyribonuclease VII large subunit
MITPYDKRIQTVSELTLSIKGLLESGFAYVTVVGEISNLKIPYSGHLYFILKDEKAQLKAVMFKTQHRYLNMSPKDGIEVICRGRISVYEARGEYQLLVDTMDFKGAGLLQIAFEKLKKQLAEEGLFEATRKKPLPLIPEHIALITSPKGAAIFDFLQVVRSRFPGIPIEIFPVRVQGTGAAEDIVTALQLLNKRKKSEVIVLCRGGGSIEDLWPFNEEKVARAIFNSQIPVLTAIGHEIDFTIADFVADVRAPTPTAAGQTVVPDQAALTEKVNNLIHRLAQHIDNKLAITSYRLQFLRQKLADPTSSLSRHLLRLDQAMTSLLQATTNKLYRKQLHLKFTRSRLLLQDPINLLTSQQQKNNALVQKIIVLTKQKLANDTMRLRKAISLLDAMSPLAVLARGYSITRSHATGKIIHDSNTVAIGETVEILLNKGLIHCKIVSKEQENKS